MDNKCNAIEGIYAFGIKYTPLFRDFSFGWVFKWIVIFLASYWAINRFSLIERLTNGINFILSYL
jgi:hypothetical protein